MPNSGIMGVGKCGICYRQIKEGEPFRHHDGYMMAHVECKRKYDAHVSRPEYKIEQQEDYVQKIRDQISAKQSELEAAEAKLERLRAGSPS
jgi:hypothetical protein